MLPSPHTRGLISLGNGFHRDSFDLKMTIAFRRDPVGKGRTAELRRQNGLI